MAFLIAYYNQIVYDIMFWIQLQKFSLIKITNLILQVLRLQHKMSQPSKPVVLSSLKIVPKF